MGLTDAQRAGLHSSASAEWYTPPDLLVEIAAFLGPDYYDPCPPHTPGTALQNALWAPWRAPLFVNPPYGRGIGQWVHRALTETGLEETLLLVPARTDARWFRECFTHAVLFFHGRLHFSGAAWNAPFPSALVYRGGRVGAFAEAFAHRGTTMSWVPARARERSAQRALWSA